MIIGWLKEGCHLELDGTTVFMLSKLDLGAIYFGWELEL
jgi:hypothetical protein